MTTCCNDNGKMVPYSAFISSTPALPSFYWDVYSQEQRIKKLCEELCKLVDYANALGVYTNADHDRIDTLYAEFEKFKESGFADYYEKLLLQWIDDNQKEIYEHLAKQVFFGLTDDGYFCAYIPDSWSDIMFDTGAVYGRSDYGRLILKMKTDSPNSIDNTYSYSLSQSTKLEQLIADLEVNSKRTDSMFDTLFTNLDSEVVAPLGDSQGNQTITKDGENT